MNLYLVRHGDALDHAEDEKRELSPEGFGQARRLGEFLRGAGICFTAAYTSPLIRARQTAETVLALTNAEEPLSPHFAGAMLNATGVEDFHHWLGQLHGEHILLVGHEPSLSARARSLLSMTAVGAFSMKKAACLGVRSRDGRAGELRFLVTPEQIDR